MIRTVFLRKHDNLGINLKSFQETEHSYNKSCIADIIGKKIPRDPLISPIYASPEDLARLPPVWFVVRFEVPCLL